MKTFTPIHWRNLALSFSIFFVFLSTGYLVTTFIIGRILIDRFVVSLFLVANLTLSAILGWRLYKNRWHTTLNYDDQELDLQVGGRKASAKWQDFRQVSLFHQGYGNFSVRLYRDDTEFMEVPTSDLRMDASAFRFEAMRLVQRGRGSE